MTIIIRHSLKRRRNWRRIESARDRQPSLGWWMGQFGRRSQQSTFIWWREAQNKMNNYSSINSINLWSDRATNRSHIAGLFIGRQSDKLLDQLIWQTAYHHCSEWLHYTCIIEKNAITEKIDFKTPTHLITQGFLWIEISVHIFSPVWFHRVVVVRPLLYQVRLPLFLA